MRRGALGRLELPTKNSRWSNVLFLALTIAGGVGILASILTVRYSGHPSFAMAKGMLMNGKLRRIIDAESSFVGLERSLEQAKGIEEFWTRLRAGSVELGFKGVRMVIDGRVFEEFASREAKGQWQLRIPLAEKRYVNFFGGVDSLDPLVLSAFANSIERGLSKWLAAQTPEALRMPVASQSNFPPNAGAGGGQANT